MTAHGTHPIHVQNWRISLFSCSHPSARLSGGVRVCKVIIAAPVAMCIEEFFDHRAEHLSDFDDPCHQVRGGRVSLTATSGCGCGCGAAPHGGRSC